MTYAIKRPLFFSGDYLSRLDFAFFLKMKVKVLLCFRNFATWVVTRVHRILFTAYHFLSVVVRIYSQNLSVIFINVFYFALVFNLNFIHVHVMKDTVLEFGRSLLLALSGQAFAYFKVRLPGSGARVKVSYHMHIRVRNSFFDIAIVIIHG